MFFKSALPFKSFFTSPKKFFSFWIYLNFCSDFFGHVEKRLNQKAIVKFKIQNVTN